MLGFKLKPHSVNLHKLLSTFQRTLTFWLLFQQDLSIRFTNSDYAPSQKLQGQKVPEISIKITATARALNTTAKQRLSRVRQPQPNKVFESELSTEASVEPGPIPPHTAPDRSSLTLDVHALYCMCFFSSAW